MRKIASSVTLACALLEGGTLTPARAADPHPAAPYVEYGAGAAGTATGLLIGFPFVGMCAHGSCANEAMVAMITLGSLGASSGVSIAGAAYPRHGSVAGAFLGGAAATALVAGTWALVLGTGVGNSGDNVIMGPLL